MWLLVKDALAMLNTTASNNTAVGEHDALSCNTTGTNNTAVGRIML